MRSFVISTKQLHFEAFFSAVQLPICFKSNYFSHIKTRRNYLWGSASVDKLLGWMTTCFCTPPVIRHLECKTQDSFSNVVKINLCFSALYTWTHYTFRWIYMRFYDKVEIYVFMMGFKCHKMQLLQIMCGAIYFFLILLKYSDHRINAT